MDRSASHFLWILFIPVLLAGCIGVTLYTQDEGARAAARALIAAFRAALQTYEEDVGAFSAAAQGLQALRADPGVRGSKGPYIQRNVPADPWGVPYRYRLVRGQPEIVSLGGGTERGERAVYGDQASAELH